MEIEFTAEKDLPNRLFKMVEPWFRVQRRILERQSIERADLSQTPLDGDHISFLRTIEKNILIKLKTRSLFPRLSKQGRESDQHRLELIEEILPQIQAAIEKGSFTFENLRSWSRTFAQIMEDRKKDRNSFLNSSTVEPGLGVISYTFEPLSISDFNKLRVYPAYPAGLILKPMYADTRLMGPIRFLDHDELNHAHSHYSKDLRDFLPQDVAKKFYAQTRSLMPYISESDALRYFESAGPLSAYQNVLKRQKFERNRMNLLASVNTRIAEGIEYIHFYLTHEIALPPEPESLLIYTDTTFLISGIESRLNKKDFGKSNISKDDLIDAKIEYVHWLKSLKND